MITEEQLALLARWEEALRAAAQAKRLIELEQELRKQVQAALFPAPKEGANTMELNAGWKLKLTYKLDRKLDEATLPAVKEELRKMNVNPDPLVKMKPELDLAAYRNLMKIAPEAGKVFDQALMIKPASPTLELISPKEAAQ